MNWILILTLITYTHSGSDIANSTTAVPGFTSKASCMSAGNAWLKHTDQLTRNTKYMGAICVEQ